MGFFSFIVLLAIAYLVWRVTDQLPDLIFRLSEIQRDVAEIRRRLAETEDTQPATSTTPSPSSTSGPTTAAPAAGYANDSPAAQPAVGEETGADYSGR